MQSHSNYATTANTSTATAATVTELRALQFWPRALQYTVNGLTFLASMIRWFVEF